AMIDSQQTSHDNQLDVQRHAQPYAPGQQAQVRVATVTPQRPLSVRFILFVTAAAALTLLLGLLGSARAQQLPSEHGIHVTGTGVVYGEPDTAVLDIGVSTVAADVKE